MLRNLLSVCRCGMCVSFLGLMTCRKSDTPAETSKTLKTVKRHFSIELHAKLKAYAPVRCVKKLLIFVLGDLRSITFFNLEYSCTSHRT
jgi:hypothetical protein